MAEAEYVVAVFMYMRLLGYPAEKISILTTYNGQKHLIRDVVNARCANNPLVGRPSKIDTVDKYQGQQNDYILLSLVRTRAVGHLRDVRRLVVAMSRARLGLYIFARASLFSNCFELTPAFRILLERPTELRILPEETYGKVERLSDQKDQEEPSGTMVVNDMQHMASFVFDFYRKKVEAIAKDPNVEKKPWARTVEIQEEEIPDEPEESESEEEEEQPVEEVRIINEVEEEESLAQPPKKSRDGNNKSPVQEEEMETDN